MIVTILISTAVLLLSISAFILNRRLTKVEAEKPNKYYVYRYRIFEQNAFGEQEVVMVTNPSVVYAHSKEEAKNRYLLNELSVTKNNTKFCSNIIVLEELATIDTCTILYAPNDLRIHNCFDNKHKPTGETKPSEASVTTKSK